MQNVKTPFRMRSATMKRGVWATSAARLMVWLRYVATKMDVPVLPGSTLCKTVQEAEAFLAKQPEVRGLGARAACVAGGARCGTLC